MIIGLRLLTLLIAISAVGILDIAALSAATAAISVQASTSNAGHHYDVGLIENLPLKENVAPTPNAQKAARIVE